MSVLPMTVMGKGSPCLYFDLWAFHFILFPHSVERGMVDGVRWVEVRQPAKVNTVQRIWFGIGWSRKFLSAKDELFGSKDDISEKIEVLKSLAFMVFSVSNGKEWLSRFSWCKRRNSIRIKDNILHLLFWYKKLQELRTKS